MTVVTQVLVDEDDPAFDEPSKPIGPVPRPRGGRAPAGRAGLEDQGRRGPRLAPAGALAEAERVIQRHMIRDAARAGHIVIACGGGGIPIKKEQSGHYEGVEAVIDKDLTSAVLATDVGAELLVILTAVPKVYVNFGKPEQRALGAVTLEEIERLHAAGHFPPGSMGPKIEAVIHFLQARRAPRPDHRCRQPPTRHRRTRRHTLHRRDLECP